LCDPFQFLCDSLLHPCFRFWAQSIIGFPPVGCTGANFVATRKLCKDFGYGLVRSIEPHDERYAAHNPSTVRIRVVDSFVQAVEIDSVHLIPYTGNG
jgi:hypothetical protein